MATMVYRGLQSCLDSQFIETSWTTRLAQMNLASSKPQFPPPFEFALKSCFVLESKAASDDIPLSEKCNFKTNPLPPPLPLPLPLNCEKKIDGVGSFDEPSKVVAMTKHEEVYVHPLVKRSRSTLSEKSLAICTEDLGNETGVDYIEAEVETVLFSNKYVDSFPSSSPTRQRVKSQRVREFPPPLTTISGEDSVRVIRSHGEDGRLRMGAVKAPSRVSRFQVERSHGRLRLSILKSADFDSKEEDKEEKEEKTNDDVKEKDENCNCEEVVGGKVEEKNEREEEYVKDVGVENEIEIIERICRCKEGDNNIDNINNNGMLLNWEPMRVATS